MKRNVGLAVLLGAICVVIAAGILAAWIWPDSGLAAEESSRTGESSFQEESGSTGEASSQTAGTEEPESRLLPESEPDEEPASEPVVAEGYTGWAQAENGDWFYYQAGQKAAGWLQIDNAWYFLSDTGVMQTGWQWYAGHWYYLDGSGVMQTGWVDDGGERYYLDGSGAMMTGFVHDGSGWYYFGPDGAWVEDYADAEVTTAGRTIRIVDGVAYVDGILIANKKYPLPRDYAPGRLTDEVQAALAELQQAAAGDGLNLYVVSGYRSYDYQGQLYQNYVNRDGKAAADRYSARPGYSEHQTGLAFDLNSTSNSFAGTPEAQWIAAHAHEYGFIVRYPQGKEAVTGYQYEPWHLRYLGKEIAQAVYDSGLCLEEYLGIASYYTND